MGKGKPVVFVHGWSVRSTSTYGELPDRLAAEARADLGLDLDIHNLWLGRYISFRDEVRIEDLSRAFEAALQRELGAEIAAGRKLVIITHSTGGPLVRDWWDRFYLTPKRAAACPMSHLIMLAPANFGSALAQLGKATVGRLRAFFQGVEPGRGVLDFLELGSPDSVALNRRTVERSAPWKGKHPVYPFVLTGQTIDQKLYDHVNSYTGEVGSDGVVRAAAANLNATYLRLIQEVPQAVERRGKPKFEAQALSVDTVTRGPRTAFALLPGLAHSDTRIGILASIKQRGSHPTVAAILRCLRVDSATDYQAACDEFDTLTARTQRDERIQHRSRGWLPDTYAICDPHSMVTARMEDDQGHALTDFDLLLLGKGSSPDTLPPGFFADRQRNRRHPGTLTFYLNHAIMVGDRELREGDEVLRARQPGAAELGFAVSPRPQEGFVHYLPAAYAARGTALTEYLRPNETLLIDIVMRRVVREGTFALTQDRRSRSFQNQDEGDPI